MTRGVPTHLSVYLNDHLAGATAAVELLDDFVDDPAFLPPGVAQRLRDDIRADRRTLLKFMVRLGISVSAMRRASGWLSEHLARLKVRIDDPADGALRHLELLEVLALGVEGKRALWTALGAAIVSQPELDGLNFAELLRRADDQRSEIERYRRAAAVAAFATGRARAKRSRATPRSRRLLSSQDIKSVAQHLSRRR
ncbi:MAG TPA: hypothetical protein VLV86_01805 [Vicinamibacterales bacterium]|nr:hypothetical protein [Vicinamibacterales bacterium]